MPQKLRTVFCPVDFSAASEEAARYAMSIAEKLGAERLDLGHVYQQPALHLPGVATKDLTQPDRGGVLEVRAPGLDHIPELAGLGGQLVP